MKDYEDKIILPIPERNSTPSWFGFIITCKEGINRNYITKYLEEHKIQTRTLFAGNIIKHPCFDSIRNDDTSYRVVGSLDNTEKVMNNTFWIGVYPGMKKEEINYMIEILKEALSK